MKVPTAFQLLTAVMTSGRPDNWSLHSEPSSFDLDPNSSLDLELSACLNVGGLQELQEPLNQTLYGDHDIDSQQYMAVDGDAWVENVIEMTSTRDLSSSGELGPTMVMTAAVPVLSESSKDVDFASLASSSISSSSAFSSSSSSLMRYGIGSTSVGHFAGLDNASLSYIQTHNAAINSSTSEPITITVDFSHVSGHYNFAASDFPDDATTTTLDVGALAQLLTSEPSDFTMTSQPQPGGLGLLADSPGAAAFDSAGGILPASLWNLDMGLGLTKSTTTGGPYSSNDRAVPGGQCEAGLLEPEAAGVRQSLRNRLHSRHSCSSTVSGSASQDSSSGDLTLTQLAASNRSLSSSTSSLALSFDEDECEDPAKQMEKREKNRLAAQKCRNRKRDKTESLEKDVSRLEGRQEKLKQEVQKLRDQRETLEELIHVHGMVCPKIRKTSHPS